MPGLVIKNLPPQIHAQLQIRARRHHRSMTKEVISILEQELCRAAPAELPAPIKLKKPLGARTLDAAKREGRE